MTTGAPPSYLRTATSPRMLVILVLLLGAAAVCARLGMWQLDRAEIRGDAEAEQRAVEQAEVDPVPIDEVLAPQTSMTGDLVGQSVVAAGTFEADEVLVPGRVHEGRTGYLVVTPLRVSGAGGDEAAAPVLAVVRGWVAGPEAAQQLEPAPEGTVRVTGYLQGGEAAGAGGLPPGQVDAISPGELVNRWGGPIYSGYLVTSGMQPAQDDALALMPPPTAGGGGLNVQNLAYALQWWIFGGFAVFVWVRLVRDEARAAVEDDEPHDDPSTTGATSTSDTTPTPDTTATPDTTPALTP